MRRIFRPGGRFLQTTRTCLRKHPYHPWQQVSTPVRMCFEASVSILTSARRPQFLQFEPFPTQTASIVQEDRDMLMITLIAGKCSLLANRATRSRGLTSLDVKPSTTLNNQEANRRDVMRARASSPNSTASSMVVTPHSERTLAVFDQYLVLLSQIEPQKL